MSLTPAQCRAARALLGISQSQLADMAKVARTTVLDFEKGARVPQRNNLEALERALDDAGIVFIPENGGGAGVRLAKPAAKAGEE